MKNDIKSKIITSWQRGYTIKQIVDSLRVAPDFVGKAISDGAKNKLCSPLEPAKGISLNNLVKNDKTYCSACGACLSSSKCKWCKNG